MSKRNEIIDPKDYRPKRPGLMYTEVLGWVDFGHAIGGDVVNILQQFRAGELSGKPYYVIEYRQTMRVKKLLRFGTGCYMRFLVKRGRTQSEIHSIALSIIMFTAVSFEQWQSMPWFSWYTDSGFSCEDLVSDLLGFYSVVRPMNYLAIIKPVSKEAALRRWDYYGPIGSFKNTGFKPLLFPDPQDKSVAHKPYKANLPSCMTTIIPYRNFKSDVVRVVEFLGIRNSVEGIEF